MQKSLVEDRILVACRTIFSKAKVLLERGLACEAHTTYSNIWRCLLTASEMLGLASRRIAGLEKEVRDVGDIVDKFRVRLERGRTVPRPAPKRTPELFRFPTPPATPPPTDDKAVVTARSGAGGRPRSKKITGELAAFEGVEWECVEGVGALMGIQNLLSSRGTT
jgi:hypothetical protein